MKKILAVLLTVLMLFGLTGCQLFTAEFGEEAISDIITDTVETVTEDTEIVEKTEVSEEYIVATDEVSETISDVTTTKPPVTDNNTTAETESAIDEDGAYTTKDDVALYIHTYGKLPKNFITKKEAQALGWEGGSLEPYAPGMCIGGNYFGNYEGLLPEKDGREYTECDIDTLGKSSRGAKRIVFSNDGLIYYTDDHYETFELLYGEE